MLNSLLSISRVRVDQRSSNPDRLCSQCNSLQHVRRSSHTAVNVDFERRRGPERPGDEFTLDLDQDFETGAGEVELSSAAPPSGRRSSAPQKMEDGVE